MEIWRQTEGRITHFVTGLGTSGTFMGVARRLRELNPKIRCISMQPDGPLHGLEGLKHMPTASFPAFTIRNWRMRRLRFQRKMRIGKSSASRVKRDCWWEFPREQISRQPGKLPLS